MVPSYLLWLLLWTLLLLFPLTSRAALTPDQLQSHVQGDFDGDGRLDDAGLDLQGNIWVCLASQGVCGQIYGSLTTLVAGDFDGNGRDDLAGLADQMIWIMLDGQTWQQLPGWLDTLIVGNFFGDGKQHLAGLGNTLIWLSPSVGQWIQVPGWLDTLVAGDFNGDGRDDLAGLANTLIWLTTEVPRVAAHQASWVWSPGGLRTLDVDRSAPQHDDLLGWNGTDCWRMHTVGLWQQTSCSATTPTTTPAPSPPTSPTSSTGPPPGNPPPTTPSRCCRVCTQGKACGNTCISVNFQCRTPPGCACNG